METRPPDQIVSHNHWAPPSEAQWSADLQALCDHSLDLARRVVELWLKRAGMSGYELVGLSREELIETGRVARQRAYEQPAANDDPASDPDARISDAVEALSDALWTLRARGAEPPYDLLHAHAILCAAKY